MQPHLAPREKLSGPPKDNMTYLTITFLFLIIGIVLPYRGAGAYTMKNKKLQDDRKPKTIQMGPEYPGNLIDAEGHPLEQLESRKYRTQYEPLMEEKVISMNFIFHNATPEELSEGLKRAEEVRTSDTSTPPRGHRLYPFVEPKKP